MIEKGLALVANWVNLIGNAFFERGSHYCIKVYKLDFSKLARGESIA